MGQKHYCDEDQSQNRKYKRIVSNSPFLVPLLLSPNQKSYSKNLKTKEPNLTKFYSILEEHWSAQAGSQPDAEDQFEDDGMSSPDEAEPDVVEVVDDEVARGSAPSMVEPSTVPPSVSTPVVPKAVIPPPPLPANLAALPLPPATINTASLDAKTRADMQAKVEALKILSFEYSCFHHLIHCFFVGYLVNLKT